MDNILNRINTKAQIISVSIFATLIIIGFIWISFFEKWKNFKFCVKIILSSSKRDKNNEKFTNEILRKGAFQSGFCSYEKQTFVQCSFLVSFCLLLHKLNFVVCFCSTFVRQRNV